ncbi:MAG TPA: alpha/beta hydrolase [Burkholderiaceae bacterium]|nr:alpha/beta hydrolase [Burkholderiaceae bacterium]
MDPSIEPELKSVTCAHPGGLHRLAYWEWGDPGNPSVVVCVHGLTRSGRDFDALAARLASRHRVVCPDMIGRGRSDRVADPMLYAPPQYVADCVTLIARLDVPEVAWVGTSMGGLIGMALASLDGAPISRLLLNDVGPVLSLEGLARIRDYVGADPEFASFEEGEAAVKRLAADFGPLTDAQWRLLTRHTVVQRDGRWRLHYDPRIAEPFRAAPLEVPPLWPLWDRIACPAWVVRGETSDLLTPEVADEMTRRGPRARRVDVAGVGHAPTFIPDDQIAIVERFLDETAPRS